MRLRWTPSAADDLEVIYHYVFGAYPTLAQPTVTLLYKTALSLKAFPFRGRPGSNPGTRELVLSTLPYIIVYRTSQEVVELLRILHGAQDRTSS